MNLKIILCLAFVLSGDLCALGLMAEVPVTPNSLDQGAYVFSVSTNSAPGGTSFHITINAKTNILSPDSSAWLGMVTHWRYGTSISPTKPETQVTLIKGKHIWKADFITSNGLLQNPDLCFIFEVIPYVIGSDGKRVPIASGEIYEVNLRDFLKP